MRRRRQPGNCRPFARQAMVSWLIGGDQTRERPREMHLSRGAGAGCALVRMGASDALVVLPLGCEARQ